MDVILVPLLLLLTSVCSMLAFVIVVNVILSWLIFANILNVNNNIVSIVVNVLSTISDYICGPIRRRFPYMLGNIDFSPIIAILLLTFVERVIARILLRFG